MELPSGFAAFQPYILPVAAVGYLVYRNMKYKRVKCQLPQLIKDGAQLVDVRSPEEFSSGSCPGSLNIPLDSLGARAGELDKEKTLILCCASGARSGIAAGMLKRQGFKNVINAGPWQNTLQND
jgi:rhodanese-related sulfurtransferase